MVGGRRGILLCKATTLVPLIFHTENEMGFVILADSLPIFHAPAGELGESILCTAHILAKTSGRNLHACSRASTRL